MKTLPLLSVLAVLATGCSAKVQRGLDERQANEILSALLSRGISAEKISEGGKKAAFTIEVRGDDEKDAIRILAELGLPRPKAEGFQELFAGGGLVSSPTEERARYLAALGGELSKTLEAVDGVVHARVHLVAPPAPRLGQPVSPAKASAFLRVSAPAAAKVRAQRDELASLISGAVEGLSADHVSIVITEVAKTEVSSRSEPASKQTGLRLALTGLSLVVSALGATVVVLLLRLRRHSPSPAVQPKLRAPTPGTGTPTLKKAA